MAAVLLEVEVRHARDVPGAVEGGADRLLLQTGDDVVGTSPELALAASVIRAGDVPVRVVLRLAETFTTNGGELERLVGLAEEYVGLGAEGVSFGFLDADLEIDDETCRVLAARLPGIPWTFHRGFDAALDAPRSWRRVRDLPGLTAVCSGGSMTGLSAGYDELLARAESDPAVARLLMPAGGLQAEQVPWFVRAGVRQFRVSDQVRPGGSLKSYVDASYVRSWRRMLDSAASGAGGVASA